MDYSFFDFLRLIGSLGLFLYGMNLMGDGLQKSAGSKLKKIIELLTSNYKEDRRLNAIAITGDGSKVLSNDGTYKTLPIKTHHQFFIKRMFILYKKLHL